MDRKLNHRRLAGRGDQPKGDQESSRRQEAALLVNTGANLLQNGDPARALPLLERAWELAPTEVAAAINLGGAYILLNRHAEAVPVLEAAAALAPDNAMVWLNLGAAYLGNPLLATPAQQDQAIRAFERVLAIDPTMHYVNYNLGLIFRDRQDYVRACEQFRRALEVDPGDRDARKLWEEMRRETAAPSSTDDVSGERGGK